MCQSEIIHVLTDKWQNSREIRQQLENPPSLNALTKNLKGLRNIRMVDFKKETYGFVYKKKEK